MYMEDILQCAILFILLILSAFFSSTETALTTVSHTRMKTLADNGNKRARKVLAVTENKEKMLSAILIGNNIVNLSASSLATTLAVRIFGSMGAGIATGILTFLILIFGEITPKNRAQKNAAKISLQRASIISALMWILTPLIFLINHISRFFLHITGGDKSSDVGMTEEELRTIVDESSESGVIEENEQQYIHNLFDFSDSTAREVMIPRIDVTMVDVNWTYDQLIKVFEKEMLTRMPVYDTEPDNLIGIINMKDLLLPKNRESFCIRDFLREPYFTYEQKNLSELFAEMRRKSIAMAIVQDEYGSVTGIVTLEDLLEELVGEIRDEYDVDEEDDIVELDKASGKYLVRATINLDDLNDMLPLELESDDYDSLGGYLIGQFDHVPNRGETFVNKDGVSFRVDSVGHQRIEKVQINFHKAVEFDNPMEFEDKTESENMTNPDHKTESENMTNPDHKTESESMTGPDHKTEK